MKNPFYQNIGIAKQKKSIKNNIELYKKSDKKLLKELQKAHIKHIQK